MPETATEKTSQRFNFTKAGIEKVECPAGKDRVYVYDTKTPGLAFVVTDKGAKSFYLYRRVGGKPERIRLGGYPELTVEQARNKAADLNGQIARGINPQEQKRATKAEPTVEDLWKWYLDKHCKPLRKPATWHAYELQYKKYLAKWKGRRLSEITHEQVLKLHRSIGKELPYMANRVLALLSAMFGKAARVGYFGADPTEGVDRFREQSRERYLAADELPRFLAAVEQEEDETLKDFFKVALFTGARRGNVQAMRWADVHLDVSEWRIPDTKSNKPQAVYIPPHVVEILKARKATAEGIEEKTDKGKRAREWVFASHSKSGHLTEPKGAWAKLLKRANIDNLHIHDLRRTLGSWQAATGASLPIIGKSLGHRHESTTKVYARLDLNPVKAAVDLATAAMLAAGEQKPTEKQGGEQ